MIEVLHGGLLSSLQDGGRPGHAHLGIGPSGAADMPARRLANALVGNDEDACVLEMTLMGPRLRLHAPVTIAVTGAPMDRARCNGQPLPMWRAVDCAAGSELEFGPMQTGCRSYLAVQGGFAADPWLGSRSVDLNASLGPMHGRAIRPGDTLSAAKADLPRGHTEGWSLDPRPWFEPPGQHPLRLMASRHTASLTEASRRQLVEAPFRIANDSNRVGIRLGGKAPMKLDKDIECVSEGLVPGIMQLPPGGQPILLGCEHPVTGGYPRIAQLAAADLPRWAQYRPGDTIRFTWVTAEEAWQACAGQLRMLDDLCRRIVRRREQHA